MKNIFFKAIVPVFIVLLGIGVIWWKADRGKNTTPTLNHKLTASISTSRPPAVPTTIATTQTIKIVIPPIADFLTRITKKHFGQYITPATSPVQPERFTGYHTGVDVEYGDATTDVPVYSVVDAKVTMAQWVSGYGGLLIIQGSINGNERYILYGHLRASSLPTVNAEIKQGDQVGVLGTAYSHETDGERRHLHFAIYAKSPVDIRGYVPKQSDLSAWEDPLTYY